MANQVHLQMQWCCAVLCALHLVPAALSWCSAFCTLHVPSTGELQQIWVNQLQF